MKTYTIVLNEQDINVVLAALAELKLKESLNTFMTIKNQLTEETKKEEKISE